MTEGSGAQSFNSFGYRRLSKIFRRVVPAAGALSAGLMIGVFAPNPAAVAWTDVPSPGAPGPKLSSSPFGALIVGLRSHPASVSRADQPAPLPPGRPAEFRWPTSRVGAAHTHLSTTGDESRKSAAAPARADGGTMFERFFGALRGSEPKSSSSALAYAAPEGGVLDDARRITSGGLFGYDRWTAVYDISAHTVHLPDGTKLEAHSGLGDKLDNPRFVHVKMRGATPPSVYELSLRERPFHGVRALRLTPLDDGRVFGRAGLLAHTYMLGPRGDSNGCVVFKNYDAFLRAFQNGQIKRLAVVERLG